MIRKRFAFVFVLLLLGAVGTLFVVWWGGRSGDDRSEAKVSSVAESAIAPRVSTETMSVGPESSTVRIDHSTYRIRFVDAVSNAGLRYVRLWRSDVESTKDTEAWIQANHEASAIVSQADLESLRGLMGASIRCRVEFKGSNPIVTCRVAHVGESQPGEPIEVLLAAFAGLRVQLSRESGSLDSPRVTAYALPPIPASITDSNRRLVLETMRASDAYAYLNELGRIEDPPEPIHDILDGDEAKSSGYNFFLPFEGDVLVSVTDQQARSTSRIVQVHPGTILDVHFMLREKSIISGRVLTQEGSPVVGVRVTVCTKTMSDPNEDFPRSSAEESSPGTIIITGENPSYPAQRAIYQQLSTMSGAEGYYRIAMPYSDDVAAWVFDSEHGKGISSRDAPGREAHVEGLDVYLTPPEKGNLVRLVDPDGVPIGNAELSIALVDEENPYQVKLPTFTTDADGFIDSWMFDDGKSYILHVLSGDVVHQRFVFGDSDEFRFQRRWSARGSGSK